MSAAALQSSVPSAPRFLAGTTFVRWSTPCRAALSSVPSEPRFRVGAAFVQWATAFCAALCPVPSAPILQVPLLFDGKLCVSCCSLSYLRCAPSVSCRRRSLSVSDCVLFPMFVQHIIFLQSLLFPSGHVCARCAALFCPSGPSSLLNH